jgi:hypothetical protein
MDQKQRKQHTCFFNAMKRKGSKQTVVQLKTNTYQVLKLLQRIIGVNIHRSLINGFDGSIIFRDVEIKIKNFEKRKY